MRALRQADDGAAIITRVAQTADGYIAAVRRTADSVCPTEQLAQRLKQGELLRRTSANRANENGAFRPRCCTVTDLAYSACCSPLLLESFSRMRADLPERARR
jgi:hypothetical protein